MAPRCSCTEQPWLSGGDFPRRSAPRRSADTRQTCPSCCVGKTKPLATAFLGVILFPGSKLSLIYFFPTEFKGAWGSPAPAKAKSPGRGVENQVPRRLTLVPRHRPSPPWGGRDAAHPSGCGHQRRKVPWDIPRRFQPGCGWVIPSPPPCSGEEMPPGSPRVTMPEAAQSRTPRSESLEAEMGRGFGRDAHEEEPWLSWAASPSCAQVLVGGRISSRVVAALRSRCPRCGPLVPVTPSKPPRATTEGAMHSWVLAEPSCRRASHGQGRAMDAPGSVGATSRHRQHSEGWGEVQGTRTFLSPWPPQRPAWGSLPWGGDPSLGLILVPRSGSGGDSPGWGMLREERFDQTTWLQHQIEKNAANTGMGIKSPAVGMGTKPPVPYKWGYAPTHTHTPWDMTRWAPALCKFGFV